MLILIYTCQHATLLEITCRGSNKNENSKYKSANNINIQQRNILSYLQIYEPRCGKYKFLHKDQA